MIKENSIKEVQEADIVSVIGKRITLKRNGAGHKASCPFHSENSPSFNVTQTKGIWKCFGCGEAGSVISFVMKYDKLNYIDAVKTIAKEENITLQYSDDPDFDKEQYEVRQTAKERFKIIQSEFVSKEHNKGIEYFMGRGLSLETCQAMGYGFCDNTEIKNEFTKEFKLTNEKNNYSFYNRVTIPICNKMGDVISFAGRNQTTEEPKYINGSNTILYTKEAILYNLHNALPEIRKKSEIIICEGYFDVAGLHNSGIKNSVAIGSANISIEQIKVIQNLKIENLRVILCLDNDVKDRDKIESWKIKHPAATADEIQKYSQSNAGREGTIKAIPKLVHFAEVRNVQLGDYKDIGDFAIKLPNKVQGILDCANDSVSWLCEELIKDKINPYEVSNAQEECAKIISRIENENIRNIYIKLNASILGTTIKDFRRIINDKLNISEEKIDLTTLEFAKVGDNYFQLIVDHNLLSDTYGVRYIKRSKEELNEEKWLTFTKQIPRFDAFSTVPNHINYQKIICRKYNGLENRFLNDYHELTHKPKEFNYDPNAKYEDIKEIATIAMFLNHIADKKKYGDRFVELLWDYITIMYRHPTRKLQALCLVSKQEGTGKSKLIELLLEIFGANSTPTTTERLTKNFNALLGGKILCTIEESKDARDELENFLKDSITGQTITIEKKSIDPRVEANFIKYVIASNHPEKFLKVSEHTTRYAVLYVPKIDVVDNNLLEKMIAEIPYFLHVLLNRKITCPDTNRLWFDPKVWENDALNKLRQASKDVVVKSLEELFENVFIKTECTEPLLRFSSESIRQMIIQYGSGKYSVNTPNFFSDVCRDKMNLYQSNSAISFPSMKIMITDTAEWQFELFQNKTRYIEVPIWKFVKAQTIADTFDKDSVKVLIKSLSKDSFLKIVAMRYDADDVRKYIEELKEIAKIMHIENAELV